jgi:hypothetical protein
MSAAEVGSFVTAYTPFLRTYERGTGLILSYRIILR